KVVLLTIERHTDSLPSGWFHCSVSPYGAVCSMHSIGLEVASSYCLHRLFTHHEIRYNQEGFDHGVGHSLLMLYDAKAPRGQKSKEFKGLGHCLSNTPYRIILYHNKIY